MIIVSACLAGHKCRYDGNSNTNGDIARMAAEGRAVCICPEALGGLKMPRRPAEIVGGDGGDVLDGHARVMNDAGEDVTDAFVAGANAALKICLAQGAKHAILKGKSPSCGYGEIYDGSFTGKRVQGSGVTAALLKRHGITVETK